MKKNSIIILIIISVVILVFLYKIRFSERARNTIRNEKNAQRIELGMSKFEMLEIMGTPNNIKSHPVESDIIIYYYEPRFGSSDGIYFHLNSSAKIVYIKNAE